MALLVFCARGSGQGAVFWRCLFSAACAGQGAGFWRRLFGAESAGQGAGLGVKLTTSCERFLGYWSVTNHVNFVILLLLSLCIMAEPLEPPPETEYHLPVSLEGRLLVSGGGCPALLVLVRVLLSCDAEGWWFCAFLAFVALALHTLSITSKPSALVAFDLRANSTDSKFFSIFIYLTIVMNFYNCCTEQTSTHSSPLFSSLTNKTKPTLSSRQPL